MMDMSTSSTNTLVDKEAIEAIKLALIAAPSVWEMMDHLLAQVEELREDLDGALRKAKEITEQLRTNIQVLEAGNPSADRGHLREDAHAFVKVSQTLVFIYEKGLVLNDINLTCLADCHSFIERNQELWHCEPTTQRTTNEYG